MNIQVELEEVSEVKRRLSVRIPAEVATEEFERVARDFKRQANLPGFRRGKVPLQLIKRRFAGDIRGEVIQKLVPRSYEQAVREKDLHPLGQPSVENLEAKEGEPIAFEASFEVKPEISLPSYKSLEVRVEDQPVTESDVDGELEKLRENNAQLVSVDDRCAENGDFVSINLEGVYLRADGEEPAHDSISEENVVVHLGDEQTHEAFNAALLGMSVGDEKSFEAEYPEDYTEKKLAGHRVRFTVQVAEIKHKQLPELNDEFAKDLREYETLDELRESLQEALTEARQRNRENEIRKALMSKLNEAVDFEVPEILLEDRIDDRLKDLAAKVISQGIDPSRSNIDWKKIREDMRPDVLEEVRSRLILEEVAQTEGLEVTQEEIDGEIDQLAGSMNHPREKVSQYFHQENRLDDLRADLRRRKALHIIRENAKVN
jgi:trigger factor